MIITESLPLMNPAHTLDAGMFDHNWRVFTGTLDDFKETAKHHYPKGSVELMPTNGGWRVSSKKGRPVGFYHFARHASTTQFILRVKPGK